MSVAALLLLLNMVAWCGLSCSPSTSSDAPSGGSTTEPRDLVAADSEASQLDPLLIPSKRPTGVAGRFRTFRPPSGTRPLTDAQRLEFEKLSAIGYVAGSIPSAGLENVTVYKSDRTSPGFNFYTSGHASVAILMDMRGTELHRWQVDFKQVWLQQQRLAKREYAQFIRRAQLFPNGDILAVWDSVGIAKLDRDSNVIWARPNMAHHDFQVLDNGDIYVLTAKVRILPRVDPRLPVREDFITLLDPEGRTKSEISLLEAFENSARYRSIWLDSARMTNELLHANSLEVLDGRIADRAPGFLKGRILTSLLLLDTIAVIDLATPEVVWAVQGTAPGGDLPDPARREAPGPAGESVAMRFHAQHDPKILANGNLLLFDNHDSREQSSVEEYDPGTLDLVWNHSGSDATPFYSRTCGAAQRLENGNTLITESDNGRAFEIDRKGDTVWEFFNPHYAGDERQFIASLLEMQRLPADFPIEWAHRPDGVQRRHESQN